jgi:hypothetical protein
VPLLLLLQHQLAANLLQSCLGHWRRACVGISSSPLSPVLLLLLRQCAICDSCCSALLLLLIPALGMSCA